MAAVTADETPGSVGRPAEAAPHERVEFRDVYEQHFAFVWRSLRRLGVAPAQLDDAAQDVFLVVHRRLADFEGRSAVRTWVFGITLRVAKDYRRSSMRRRTEPLDDDRAADSSEAPEALTEAARAAALVHRLLEHLDDDRRAVFVLAELEQMTAPEISALLHVNLNTVYSRLRAARRDFEQALARHTGAHHG